MAEFHRIITDTNTTLATSSQYTQYGTNNERVSNNVTISKIVLTAQRDVTVKMLETLSLKRPVLKLHSLNLSDLTNLYGLEKLN